ncbi:hypothetical protein EK21DRAFT_84543 [Setomelanomma holmii]|uniref:Uncharacterized protein n=1 Tax=Setomelanomma holmii TaxID=210430 RepID=A0A9P4HM40_9PLEO|nr:hypothetical protein EK21DRAFT_84543 [Setomelanomma holmii]
MSSPPLFGIAGKYVPPCRRSLPSPPSSPRRRFMASRPSSSSSSGSQNPWELATWEYGLQPPTPPPSPPLRPRRRTLSPPSFGDAQEGMVFHLPKPAGPSVLYKQIDISEEPWTHPVVVVGKQMVAEVETVQIRTCTSFGHRRIEASQRKPCHYQWYILADNKEDTVLHDCQPLARFTTNSQVF